MNGPSSADVGEPRRAIVYTVVLVVDCRPVAGLSCIRWVPSVHEPQAIHQLPLASVNGAGSIALSVVVVKPGGGVLVLVQDLVTKPRSVHGPCGALLVATPITASAPELGR